MSVQEIEEAAKELPTDELDGLVTRLFDFSNERWDMQIESLLCLMKPEKIVERGEQSPYELPYHIKILETLL